MTTLFKLIPIEWLKPGKYQPRTYFSEETLNELADSIRSQGLIEPLLVREVTKNNYEIIAGERRWRAAMMASLSELPCLITDYSDKDAAAVTLIENIQRENLNSIEEAHGYRRLTDEFHFQQDDIAALVGKSRSHIANVLRLLTLSEPVQHLIQENRLSMGHAKILVGLSAKEQLYLAKKAEEQSWSVRYLEKKVKELKMLEHNIPSETNDRDIERLETKIAEQIGTPVKIIVNDNEGGVLQLKFFDNDTLAGLLERMGLRYD